MQIDVQVNSEHWQQQDTPHGRLFYRGFPTSVDALVAALVTVAEGGEDPAFRDVTGHWSAILETSTGIAIAQDVLRSWPIFIADTGKDRLVVTESIETARAATPGGLSSDSVDEFLHLGYVTGADTLFEGITQLQAFEWRWLSETGEQRGDMIPLVRHDVPGINTDEAADARFSQDFEIVLDRMFAALGERQIVLPLSGGLDSRLLAVALKDRGYENVVAFTYGVAETAEVRISREVAKAVGYRWEFIQFTPAEIREAWATPEAGAFIRDAYEGSALPHVQDWYALREMKRLNLVDDDAIFLPGHTVVGAMHDEEVMDIPGHVSSEQLTELILHHHGTIRPNGQALRKNHRFMAKLDSFYTRIGYDGTPGDRLFALEYWNAIERQTKYINNSMRAYEHFGYDWALPMYDKELLAAWFALSAEYTQDRDWYRRYVNRRYAATTRTEINTFEGFAAANIAQSKRDKIKGALRAVGALEFVERKIRAQAVAHHPMALNEFLGAASAKDLNRYIMRGGQPLGMYAEQLLADTWNPHTNLFTK
ncbi:hypothetical protein ICL81_09000 [Leucobacter sp. cx-328]|uniref:asparagine synthase-related protein n=1 Tax=unclassified Leucobacter TaxID=2621730 RepID=UPI00165E38FB|nr:MULTISPECIES: asparagine synthase C-terminal domain-containing protein [unclassified Leucobacter]MBC9944643.1 hypothetical protein [Leucobacter sp. cx-328]